jgi:prepilin-type N-terminal cleavage/methylation domain-containing protein
MKNKKNRNSGFTLIELLVVISLISLMSSIMLVTFKDAKQKAKETRWKADVAQLQKAYELYFQDHNYYPFANGPIPVAELQPYSQGLTTDFLQGEGSYFALSRGQSSDPVYVGISDDGSNCIRIHNGYLLAIGATSPNNETINDGGIDNAYYEKIGGDYKLYYGTPGLYGAGNICADY